MRGWEEKERMRVEWKGGNQGARNGYGNSVVTYGILLCDSRVSITTWM